MRMVHPDALFFCCTSCSFLLLTLPPSFFIHALMFLLSNALTATHCFAEITLMAELAFSSQSASTYMQNPVWMLPPPGVQSNISGFFRGWKTEPQGNFTTLPV